MKKKTLAATVARGVAAAMALGGGAAGAETAPAPQNVLNMNAQASVEVQQDLLSITLATSKDGSDASAVQAQLRQALDAALVEARKAVRPGQMDVRTGQFALNPRYTPKGGIGGWQGTVELVLEGRDMSAIAQLAGKLNTLTVARVGYGLSREAREKVEGDATAQAIAKFRARAADYAKQFGFTGFTLREVSVSGGEQFAPMPMVRAQAMRSSMVADESVPVEAGKATVTVAVNGSIQLTK
jgi:predicted secreted protein